MTLFASSPIRVSAKVGYHGTSSGGSFWREKIDLDRNPKVVFGDFLANKDMEDAALTISLGLNDSERGHALPITIYLDDAVLADPELSEY